MRNEQDSTCVSDSTPLPRGGPSQSEYEFTCFVVFGFRNLKVSNLERDLASALARLLQCEPLAGKGTAMSRVKI